MRADRSNVCSKNVTVHGAAQAVFAAVCEGDSPILRRKRWIIGKERPLCRENWDSPPVNGYRKTVFDNSQPFATKRFTTVFPVPKAGGRQRLFEKRKPFDSNNLRKLRPINEHSNIPQGRTENSWLASHKPSYGGSRVTSKDGRTLLAAIVRTGMDRSAAPSCDVFPRRQLGRPLGGPLVVF